jgi:hypothetical protein
VTDGAVIARSTTSWSRPLPLPRRDIPWRAARRVWTTGETRQMPHALRSRARIAACADLSILDRWFDNALAAKTIADVFA